MFQLTLALVKVPTLILKVAEWTSEPHNGVKKNLHTVTGLDETLCCPTHNLASCHLVLMSNIICLFL